MDKLLVYTIVKSKISRGTDVIYVNLNSSILSSWLPNFVASSCNRCLIFSTAAHFDIHVNQRVKKYSKPTQTPPHFYCSF